MCAIVQKELQKALKQKKFDAKHAEQQQAASLPSDGLKAKKEKFRKSTAVDTYEPRKIEEGRYEWWESRGYFKPEFTHDGQIKPKSKFVISMPPPNVTGALHMGHALTNALQDTMVRHARMKGKITVWVPGMDHASISTQGVVEKMLWETEGKTRHDLGREALLERIWLWKEKYHANITK